MTNRTKLEIITRNMIAYDVLQAPLSSLYQKAKRRQKTSAKSAAELIRAGETGDRVYTNIEDTESEKARTLRQGINVFKEAHPRYGAKLENMISETRTQKNQVLTYGLSNGFKLGTNDYIRVMKDLGLSETAAHAMYGHLIEISDKLGKAQETGYREILL